MLTDDVAQKLTSILLELNCNACNHEPNLEFAVRELVDAISILSGYVESNRDSILTLESEC